MPTPETPASPALPGTARVPIRQAATLILYRAERKGLTVLMGLRHSGLAFAPGVWVFPGGRLDRSDFYVPSTPLAAGIEARLAGGGPKGRGRALAVAAIRETCEETGLVLGSPSPLAARLRDTPAWTTFKGAGVIPAVHRLDYLARAVAPPRLVRRYDTRFFLAPAEHALGEARPTEELTELAWIPVEEAARRPLVRVTRAVLTLIAPRLTGEHGHVSLLRDHRGALTVSHEA